MQLKVYETKYVKHSIKDGIMIAVYAPNLVVTLDLAKEMVEDRIRFSNGKTMPVLVDIRGLASLDTPSRKFFTTARAILYISAGAFVVESSISRLLGNVFIKVDRPPVPTKIFTDMEKALKWLQQYKQSGNAT